MQFRGIILLIFNKIVLGSPSATAVSKRVFMNKLFYLCLVFTLSVGAAWAQTPKRSAAGRTAAARRLPVRKTVKPPVQPASEAADPADEKAALEDAIAAETPSEKVEKIKQFLKRYPASAEKTRALESLTVARAAIADERLAAGDIEAAQLFRTALNEAPVPYSDRFFTEVVSRIPANLYWRGRRSEALDAARAIEKNIGANVNQLLVLANFYVSVENGDEAKRLAEAAIKVSETSAGAYIIAGHANRLNFALEDAAAAYAKALELEPTSLIAMRGKAEMNRALGKPAVAAEIYREIVAKNDGDQQARAGLVLSLFDAGKRSEAEAEMAKALEANPNNVVLLAGAAYWYAAQNEPSRAVELGQTAVAAEPRYIWSHIALARGLIAQQKPLDAERVLTNARKFGNFPTLEYEIAMARMLSGFYREAAAELAKSFAVVDGAIETRLGGRVPRREKSLTDLVAYERRASIFEPAAAEAPGTAERLATLLDFSQKLNADTIDENAVTAAADRFVSGDDTMKLHRELFVANALLQKRAALPKVLELTKSAIGNTDAALDGPEAPAAVMANELFESRTIAFARGDYLLVPSVPRNTLSAILRGRIEEITGRALYAQKNYPDAIVRLRRAISVYPKDSAWMRSGMWHLGEALEADGKDEEALDNYVKSYKTDKPDVVRYVVVENLYRKVKGSLDGFEALVGSNPLPPVTADAPAAVDATAASRDAEPPAGTPPAETVTVESARAEPEKAETPQTATPESATPTAEPAEPEKTDAATTEAIEVPAATAEPATSPTDAKIEPALDAPKTEPAAAVPSADTVPSQLPTTEVPTTEPAAAEVENETPADPLTDPAKSDAEVNRSELPVPEVPPPAVDEPKPAASASPAPVQEPVGSEVKSDATPKDYADPGKPAEQPEPQPTESPAQIVSEPPKPEPQTEQPQSKSPTEHKPVALEVVKTDLTLKPATPKATAKNKPLFEPVIITIPGGSAAKNTTALDGENRPRLVPGSEVHVDAPSSCSLALSDESVSVINDGGSVGILVTVSGDTETELAAVSSSPGDIDVKADPEFSGSRARRFYIVKSISSALGLYDVTFTAPCGKGVVKVKVR